MNRHALVIGSQTYGLSGAVHDATSMTKVLTDREFNVDLRVDERATRDGILAGYDALIATAEPDDAAVVYYVGHGTFALNRRPDDRLRTMQAIVPTDYVEDDPDFRAITAWELSIKLAQLTARTRNVTVILDCCHAAQMSRDGAARAAVPRALPHPIQIGFRAHLDRLEAMYGEVPIHVIGNPHAVRFVACAQTESAWEYTTANGVRGGVFTEALIDVLNEIDGAPLSWASVGNAVRARVLARFPVQRPEVEGPSQRQLFSLAFDDRTGIVPITVADHELRIQTGEILGTARGDIYAAMPLGSKSYDETRAIARLEVIETAALYSTVEPAWSSGHTALPADAVAVPVELTAASHPVTVIGPDADRAVVIRALQATRTLRVAMPTEANLAVATLRLAGSQLTIEDPAGPIFPAIRYPDQLDEALENLANLGVVRRIGAMVGEHGLSSRGLEITWGVVERGQPRPMPDQGASLGLGDRIYIKVRNHGSDPRYVHIVNVGLRGKVTLLTRGSAPAGVALNSQVRELVLGERDGKLHGLELHWPAGLPEQSFPRTDSLYVFATEQPVDLHQLETHEHVRSEETRGSAGTRGSEVTRGRRSKLQQRLAQMHDGRPCDLGAPDVEEGFMVKLLSYQLHPRKAAMANTVGYQIDDNPGGDAAARSPDAWITGGAPVVRGADGPVARGADGPVARGARAPAGSPAALPAAPDAISIRLGDLVVERNRALFSADIRIDALVCTRSPRQPETFAAHTMRFQGIQDGERLPLDRARLFHGPVRDFVDICLWVSRDTTRDRNLVELFAQHATSPQFRDAATALVATAAVSASPWITAVGASAALARIAYDLILAVESRTIGLYRTSFLAAERFGVGRHPAEALYRAQDFSFSLLIEPVACPAD